MKIFTVSDGESTIGARVESFTLKGANITIPAILVGENGRGRELGVLPVQLTKEQYDVWKEKGEVEITFATLGKTRAGNPKLFADTETTDTDTAIVVFRTGIGFRGGNSHTGDRCDEFYTLKYDYKEAAMLAGVPLQDRYTEKEAWQYAPVIWKERFDYETELACPCGFEHHLEFLPFPGEIFAKGKIAQGAAGRMGCGEQIVAVIPVNQVFRTAYSGRLYGSPSAHYYIYQDGKILSATWQERQVSDIF